MAQKDKVKELVGRGLNSYHTKSLQQIDRIEKKNKEQNHKISILSNELDNDYLTKTEEGSVISLEHSKEGMVYLDELQGNTLVNYCTDGSKEMTLNGDIDIEGTFVTTTEGVDNGKVDVMCEGNTLVNLNNTNRYAISKAISDTNLVITSDTNYLKATTNGEIYNNNSWVYANFGKPKLSLLKPNTKYTVIGDLIKGIGTMAICEGSTANALTPFSSVKNNRVLLTTNNLTSEINGQILYGWIKNNEEDKPIDIEVKNLIILEGDWLDKEIPPYFEGMKSVGQDNVNGHKIEILSQNKNLFNGVVSSEYSNPNINFNVSSDGVLSATNKTLDDRTWNYDKTQYRMKLKKGNYTITLETITPSTSQYSQTIIYKKGVTDSLCMFGINTMDRVGVNSKQISLNEDTDIGIESKMFDGTFRIQIEEGSQSTTFTPYKLNKKEILLNEPLRSLPNGVKDKKVKIGNKWYIERNCGEITLNGTQTITLDRFVAEKENQITFFIYIEDMLSSAIQNNMLNLKCDKFAITREPITNENIEGMSFFEKEIRVHIIKSKLSIASVDGFKTWLQNNPTKVVYQLAIPKYEEITDPTLLTYLDTTHISNNSIIPCNMKIQNSGYNAIIKPSTLYTVAVDTNKSGTVGMNLGGTKGTTTNNVLTLTTPATLSDDSLRLYGKGIKGSKVRLIEGDKTNWIPSHFEGMKSSFEDKLQDDGTYKMEILSNNKNLLNMKNFVSHYNIDDFSNGVITSIIHTGDYGWVRLRLTNTYRLKAGTYYLQFKMRSDNYRGGINHVRFETIIDKMTLEYSSKLINPNCNNDYQTYELKFIAEKDFDINYLFIQCHTTTSKNFQIKDLMLSRLQSDLYIPYEVNKIQFSSIEPLRKWDRFVFNDGQLMVERCSKNITFNGSEPWGFNNTDGTTTNRYFLSNAFVGGTEGQDIENTLCDKLPTYQWSQTAILGISRTTTTAFVYNKDIVNTNDFKKWLSENNLNITYRLAEPTYEEIPFELQKIILEGYENGTLFFDTNIPPTSTVTYAGETPIVKSVKLNKTEVLNNTNDINDNIVPYLMDMDYRVVCLQLQSENINDGVSMARLFGGAYEMLQRDIQSKRYSIDEYRYRLDAYLGANKITEDEYNKLGDMLND